MEVEGRGGFLKGEVIKPRARLGEMRYRAVNQFTGNFAAG